MALLALPAELRLRIYEHLPGFCKGQTWTIATGNAVTPAVSRASKLLRQETLPFYAQKAHFAIPLDEGSARAMDAYDPVAIWLNALGDSVDRLTSMQLNRHWKITQPTRWQTHVGFYLRFQLVQRATGNGYEWKCDVGTYPIARDIRGMRLESAELLRRLVVAHIFRKDLSTSTESTRLSQRLEISDIELIRTGMNIVANNPISTYDFEQDHANRHGRGGIFKRMEQELYSLFAFDENISLHGICSTPY